MSQPNTEPIITKYLSLLLFVKFGANINAARWLAESGKYHKQPLWHLLDK